MAADHSPAALRGIIAKAIAERQDDRYPDIPSLAQDVTRFLDGEAVSAYRETFFDRAVRMAKRHRIAIGIVLTYLAGRALIFLFTGR
jgi:eukaryotic-like serine/threonine-protein kinase